MDRGKDGRRANVADAKVAEAETEVMGKCNGYNNLAPFYVFISGAELKILVHIFY